MVKLTKYQSKKTRGTKPLKILLIVEDLYQAVGGGQTVYRKIVESTPGIKYFYFRNNERSDALRPNNSAAVPLNVKVKTLQPKSPLNPIFRENAAKAAEQFARSVKGMSFDIVEIPDYYTFGSELKQALIRNDVKFKKIVVALHGNISNTLAYSWDRDAIMNQEIRDLEEEQFRSADAAYGLSLQYIREWTARIQKDVYYVDPLNFVEPRKSSKIKNSEKPNIIFLGRTERIKGPDLFIEIVRWLSDKDYKKALIVGPQDYTGLPHGSAHHLSQYADRRTLSIEYIETGSREEIEKIYEKPAIFVLPSREDTLNLIALEALSAGMPVAVSTKAGVCEYLETAHPKIPFIKLDIGDAAGCALKLTRALRSFGGLQEQVRRAAERCFKEASYVRANFKEFYKTVSKDADWVKDLDKPSGDLTRLEFPSRGLASPKPIRPGNYLQAVRDFYAHYLPEWDKIRRLPERTDREIQEKLQSAYRAEYPIYRGNIWLEISRLERKRGNNLMAACMESRVLRLSGYASEGTKERIFADYQNAKLREVASIHHWLTPNMNNSDHVLNYLQESYLKNKKRPKVSELEKIEVSNPKFDIRISVIVSLYNAAPKLEKFLAGLEHQLNRNFEVILVDSGSPSNEWGEYKKFACKSDLPITYARSKDRETIQAAWNRGIKLAQGEYLVFLGVDEMLYPNALNVLSDVLQNNLKIDWVMANSLVTEVDSDGGHVRDLMIYDRGGACRDHVFLETCYISYVAGMYRKSIHNRHGFYDESFSAAGDTEFKSRVIRHLNVKYIPATLGVFWNYPDGQTTASPKAEIEDARAWYIYRTEGGVKYTYQDAQPTQLKEQVIRALGYRKSYLDYQSHDVEYAYNIIRAFKLPRSLVSVRNALRSYLQIQRAFELTLSTPNSATSKRMAQSLENARNVIVSDLGLPPDALSGLFKDNRFEQHFWIWKTC